LRNVAHAGVILRPGQLGDGRCANIGRAEGSDFGRHVDWARQRRRHRGYNRLDRGVRAASAAGLVAAAVRSFGPAVTCAGRADA